MNAQKIDSFLLEKLDEYIDLTARLCAQPSISARGEGVRECSVLVADILRERGFDTQVFETDGEPIIVARKKGKSDRTLLFYNHYDVQPPEPLELWTTPPFEPTIRDGAFYARGAKDDKGEFICRLAAVEAVQEANGGELPCNVTFLVEGQEEIGSPHIKQFVDEHLELVRCDAAIWEEGGVDNNDRPSTSLGARGMLGVELSVETANRDTHSGGGHVVPSSTWRLL